MARTYERSGPLRYSCPLSAPAAAEEGLQQGSRITLPDAADDFRPVMTAAAFKNPGSVFDAAALGIIGAEDEAADAGKGDRLGAHGTRLQRYIEIAVWQARPSQQPAGLAQGQEFRMGCGIMITLHL